MQTKKKKRRIKKISLLIIAALVILLGLQQVYCYRYTPVIGKERIEKAYDYAVEHDMNTNIFIFVDFSIPSGKNRFVVYNRKKKKIILKGLCAHGPGKGSTMSRPVFSNEPGSNCSSLGRYKVCYYTRTRTITRAYVLQGLDSTNSNAASRGILIHPSKTISLLGFGCYPAYIPLGKISYGCFSISKGDLKKLKKIIESSEKSILLMAYK